MKDKAREEKIKIFESWANVSMTQFNMSEFKRTHPTLLSAIICSMEDFAKTQLKEQREKLKISEDLRREGREIVDAYLTGKIAKCDLEAHFAFPPAPKA